MAAERKGYPIRIWSAACATGEEPLSIAMRLNEAGWFDRAEIDIRASDLSPSALARAKNGSYRERSFRALPSDLKEKYFEFDGEELRIDEGIRSRIIWSNANLLNKAQIAPLAASSPRGCR